MTSRGLLYGMVLTNARAVGEFGAVAVVSGNIIGRTQTLTLFVESAYKECVVLSSFVVSRERERERRRRGFWSPRRLRRKRRKEKKPGG